METRGFILISNNGNHTGFNRKWESDQQRYTCREAMRRMKEFDLDGLQMAIFVATEYDRLPQFAYTIDCFDGGTMGYCPNWLDWEVNGYNDL